MPPVKIVYEIHVAVLDIELQDRRRRGYRTASGRLRPFLTLVIFPQAGLVMAFCLSAGRPNWRTLAALLYAALAHSADQLYGGIPNEVRIHESVEAFAPCLQHLCGNLGVTLNLPTNEYRTSGEAERLHGRLIQMTEKNLSAYMGMHHAGNRSESPTLQDLEAVLKHSLIDYHQSENSQTGQSPLTFWQTRCFPGQTEPGRLTALLSESIRGTIVSTGIQYGPRWYWHDALAALPAGTEVLIYPTLSLSIPKSVEVFYQDTWVCTASAYRC